MRLRKRKRLWVDPKIQGALVGRFLLYWVSCIISVALLRWMLFSVLQVVPEGAGRAWLPILPELLASLFFVPLMIHFRDGDLWHEFAEAFNKTIARVQAEPEPEMESAEAGEIRAEAVASS